MKTLEDGWYIVINTYEFTVFEIWRDFCIIIYCRSTLSLHNYRVYRLYDSVYRLYDTHTNTVPCSTVSGALAAHALSSLQAT